MIILHRKEDLQNFAAKNAATWSKSGFVPTMGALHEGHISLIRQSQLESSITVASIFINPSQFNNQADFANYPVTLDQDILLLEECGCDVLFLPDLMEIYPDGWNKKDNYDLGSLDNLLEGFYRPGHFQGVCQVVHRLLEIVKPTAIFMGQKDFQQCMVVNRLIELKAIPVELYTCPTLREEDGLAMSSRNMRLTPNQRKVAPAIYREMQQINQEIAIKPFRELEKRAIDSLLEIGFNKVEYVSIATPATLEPLTIWEPNTKLVVLVAAFLGEVRLIDNLLI